MKTQFTEDQLADPELQVAAEQLRKCVHCGFCLATCPTYVTLGNELDSPRGRIVLMQDFLERGTPSQAVVDHVDRCLSCLACSTTCPSGVNYMHLVDHARARIEASGVRRWADRWLRGVLGWLLPRPQWFRVALWGAPLGRLLAPLLPAPMRAMVGLAPQAGARRASLPSRTEGPAVALLTGCVQSVLDVDVLDATVRVLERLGASVAVIEGVGCCGAVTHHLGQHEATLERVRSNVRALQPHLGSLTAIVSTVSGCGTMLEDYGHLLRNDPLGRCRGQGVRAGVRCA